MPMAQVGGDVPARSSLTRVDFFRREPGGGTLFVKPAGEEPGPTPATDAPEMAGTATD
jgi:hypothetical protein